MLPILRDLFVADLRLPDALFGRVRRTAIGRPSTRVDGMRKEETTWTTRHFRMP
jgi:hypothetical protein